MASAASQTWTARQSWQVVKEFFNDVFADERQGQLQQSNPFRKRDEAVVKDRFDFVIGGSSLAPPSLCSETAHPLLTPRVRGARIE